MEKPKRGIFRWLWPSSLRRNNLFRSSQHGLRSFRSSLGFSDDNILATRWWRLSSVLDPRSDFVKTWQYVFIIACLLGVFLDPLFFFLPISNKKDGQLLMCVYIQHDLAVVVTLLRTVTDLFYVLHMYMQFRIAFIAPSTRTFGRGELVKDPVQIRRRYLRGKFALDVLAVLPLPQVFLWGVIPYIVRGEVATNSKNTLRYLVFIQYIPRIYRVWPLLIRMQKNAGIIMTTAWAGAFVNLLLYLLVSHVAGAVFYLLAVERNDHCWRVGCSNDANCHLRYLDCGTVDSPERQNWWNNSTTQQLRDMCMPKPGPDGDSAFNFGIYGMAVLKIVFDEDFAHRYFWSLWWGLQTLSSVGQNLMPSTFIPEDLFCITIAIVGLTLFALLVGNIQAYLSSLTLRLEKMRLKRRDTENWMKHRQVPNDLRKRVRAYDQFRWVVTHGVDEEGLIREWPADLRRDIKRHLCLDLVRRVPLFEDMDERLLDAICMHLRPALFTEDSIPLREDDPVPCMFFIFRGHVQSITTNGGRTGFFNVGNLGPGQFFGEELLTWALDPQTRDILPLSTRTIKTQTEVEAFALMAEDLKFVAAQYRRLHSRQLQHRFRFHSQHWRTWAACSIQAAWRRYRKRKLRKLMEAQSSTSDDFEGDDDYDPSHISRDDGERTVSLGAAAKVTRFARNMMNPVNSRRKKEAAIAPPSPPRRPPAIPKPHEPDFSHLDPVAEEAYAPPRVGYSGMLTGYSGMLTGHSGFLGAPVPPIRTAPRNVNSSGPLDAYGQSMSWVPRSGYLGGPSRASGNSGFLGNPTGNSGCLGNQTGNLATDRDMYKPYEASRVGFTGPL